MSDVAGAVDRLRFDAESGSLAALCADLGVDLLVLFGSALDDPSTAHDVDVAYGRRRGVAARPHLDVVNALAERYGDYVDVMSLDDAGSVARYEALHGIDVLVELTPGRYANAQMAAFGEYCDTQRFRDRVLEALTR